MTPIRHVVLLSLFLTAPCWASEPATAEDKPTAEQRPSLTLDNPEVRKALRESARELESDEKAEEIPATKVAATIQLPAVSLRRPVVVEVRRSSQSCRAVRAAGVFAGWSSQLRQCDGVPTGDAELYEGAVTRLIQFQDVDVHDSGRLRAKRLQGL